MPRRITTRDLADARARLQEIDRKHGVYFDELLADFGKRLDAIVEKSSAQIVALLEDKLSVDEGVLLATTPNLRALQNLGELYQSRMKANGLDALLRSFVQQFPNQLPLLTQTLAQISRGLNIPIAAAKLLTPADQQALTIKSQQTLDGIRQVVADAGMLAKRRALAQVNGLKPRELERLIEKTFDISRGQSQTLAATGMAVFYRTATDRAFKAIEKETPLRFVYDGPDDVLTRPFCHELKMAMREGKSWTRDEIDAMNNGQLPDVFSTGGGYNCRHQWRIDMADMGSYAGPGPGVRPSERQDEQALEKRERQKAKRKSLAIAKLYPENAPLDLQRDNLLAQAKVYEDAGFKVPGSILRNLSGLSGSPEQLAADLEAQLAKATAAASVLDRHGARAAWRRQQVLIARLREQLTAARAARKTP